MTSTARVQKAEIVVLGNGLAAATVADALSAAGRRVAWLVEGEFTTDLLMDELDGYKGLDLERAQTGFAWLQTWVASLPGISITPPNIEIASDDLFPALVESIANRAGCGVATGTRVRGISIIEGKILGVIAEDARHDARIVINAADDSRFAAFARMMRQDQLAHFPPDPTMTGASAVGGGYSLPTSGAGPLLTMGLALAFIQKEFP